jgi:cytochrome c peroxidase
MKRIAWTGWLIAAAALSGAPVTAAAPTPVEQLGKSIFFDQELSIHRNQSCATCHGPNAGWTGPASAINAAGAVYEGSVPGRFGNRKPPSSAYATPSPILHYAQVNQKKDPLFVGGNFWDGRATGEKLGTPAADQAQGPFLNPLEQGLPAAACVVHRVCTAAYGPLFEAVWGAGACAIAWPADVQADCATEGGSVALSDADQARSDMAYDAIALSIAAYEGSAASNAFTSKFDYWRRGMAKLTDEEQRGFSLFKGKAKCARCHDATPSSNRPPLFTDFSYDNLGVPRNPDNPFYTQTGFNPDGHDWIDAGLGGFLATRPDYAPFSGRTWGAQKVPTLRNVDLRPFPGFVKAYGHNGFFKSLEGIVHFYNTRDAKPTCPSPFYTEAQALAAGCWPEPEVPQNVNTSELGFLNLTPQEEAALVAFMKTLSDGYVP